MLPPKQKQKQEQTQSLSIFHIVLDLVNIYPMGLEVSVQKKWFKGKKFFCLKPGFSNKTPLWLRGACFFSHKKTTCIYVYIHIFVLQDPTVKLDHFPKKQC